MATLLSHSRIKTNDVSARGVATLGLALLGVVRTYTGHGADTCNYPL